MEARTRAVHRTIVAVDIEGFGDPRRMDPVQVTLRAGLYGAMQEAFGRAGIPWGKHEDRGNGMVILVGPDVPERLLVESLPPALADALRAHNRAHPEAERIRLRMALNSGEVTQDEHGIIGASITLTFRLLDSDPVKRALKDSPGALAIIVSSGFYEGVVRHSTAAASYHQERVAVKETMTAGWVCVPDQASRFGPLSYTLPLLVTFGSRLAASGSRRTRTALIGSAAAVAAVAAVTFITASLLVGNPPPPSIRPVQGHTVMTLPPSRPAATVPAAKGGPGVSVAFGRQGTLLAIGHANGSTSVWSVSNSSPVTASLFTAPFTDQEGKGVNGVAISPDSQFLATGDKNDSTYLWTIATRKSRRLKNKNGGHVSSVAFSPDGKYLAAGDSNGTTYLWTTAYPYNHFDLTDPGGHSVTSVAFSPDGHYLAAGDSDGTTYLFSIAGGKGAPHGSFANPGSAGVSSVAFSPDGGYLAAGDHDGAVYLWAVASHDHRDLSDPHGTGIDSVTFSADGKYLFAGDDNGATYAWPTADYFKVKAVAPFVFFGPNGDDALSLSLEGTGELLAVGDALGRTELWPVTWTGS